MKTMASLALVALAHAGVAAAGVPSSAEWIRINGAPHDGCLAPVYEINVTPDFALLASSTDRRITWAVAADSRGLSVVACFGNVIHSDLLSGKVTGDKTDLVFKSLLSVTHETLAPGVSASQRAEYFSQIGRLRGSLPPKLQGLIQDAQRLHPGFLKKDPEISLPHPGF